MGGKVKSGGRCASGWMLNAYRIAARLFAVFMWPVNRILARLLKDCLLPGSVLHISYMVHVPYYMSRTLRGRGVNADYLAISRGGGTWSKADYLCAPEGPLHLLLEWWMFWSVVARYEVIHSHFGLSLSSVSGTGWELPLLKMMGRRIVVHFRGCEVRDSVRIKHEWPSCNICQDCDYGGTVCGEGRRRVELAKRYGDAFLVTTPDMLDFVPEAEHLPFMTPDIPYEKYRSHEPRSRRDGVFKIVHATNHPGIEGTVDIDAAIGRLKDKGFKVEFKALVGVPPERIYEELRDADLSIGKMKMGYYANAQIESMFLGVPAFTWVRDDLMTLGISESGLIVCSLEDLEGTLEKYLSQPGLLDARRRMARNGILKLHDNARICGRLVKLYGFKRAKAGAGAIQDA